MAINHLVVFFMMELLQCIKHRITDFEQVVGGSGVRAYIALVLFVCRCIRAER